MPASTTNPEQPSDYLTRRGFNADQLVYECGADFTVDDLKESLFGSTYNEPKPLLVRVDHGVELKVVVNSVEQYYPPFTDRDTDDPLGCQNHPEWKIQGWLLKSGFDPYQEIVRVKMYVETDTDGRLGPIYLQRIGPEKELTS